MRAAAATAAFAAVVAASAATSSVPLKTLPKLGGAGSDIPAVSLRQDSITVSGLSSGAFMAVQMHISFSSVFTGVGALAGGPFFCAEDSLLVATTSCMTEGWLIDAGYLAGIVFNTAAFGFADPVSNLKNSRVWLMSATNDSVVVKSVVEANYDVYASYVPASSIRTVFDRPGEHAMQTLAWGNSCDSLGTPYINNCGFDAVGDMLTWLLPGQLTPPAPKANLTGNVYSFNQGAFYGGEAFSLAYGLAQTAFLYVPAACLANSSFVRGGGACLLHVALHGCEQTTDDIGMDFVEHAGYNEWADANNMVVLYPQAIESLITITGTNPKGCWDWFAYTGTAYSSNAGIQTSLIKRIMDYILGDDSAVREPIVADPLSDPQVAARWAKTLMAQRTANATRTA